MTLGVFQLGMIGGGGAAANGSLVTGAFAGAVGYYTGYTGSISSYPEFDPQPFAAIIWDPATPTQVQILTYLSAGTLTIGGTDIALSGGDFGSGFPGGRLIEATVATALPVAASVVVPFNLTGGVMPPTYLGTIGVVSIPAEGFGYIEGISGTITDFPALASQPFTQLSWSSPSSETITIVTRLASGLLHIGDDTIDLATLPSIGGGRRGGTKPLSAALGGTNPALAFALVSPAFPVAAVYPGAITVGDGSLFDPAYRGFYQYPGMPEYSFGAITPFPALSPQPFVGLIWSIGSANEVQVISAYSQGILRIGSTDCDLSTLDDNEDGTFGGAFALSTALSTTVGASVPLTLTNPA